MNKRLLKNHLSIHDSLISINISSVMLEPQAPFLIVEWQWLGTLGPYPSDSEAL